MSDNIGTTYLVGGAVRDALLGLPVREHDYVVVGSTPAAMLAQGFTQVGKDFPVFLHPHTKDEHALTRTERKTAPGYRGFAMDTDPSITLEQDLARRDLTINAIAQDSDGNLIDPYHGQADIQAKCLRHVSDAFLEDPLRVLRLARFHAHLHHLGFTIAPETHKLAQQLCASGELEVISKERLWTETYKALRSTSPWVYFRTLQRFGAWHRLCPDLAFFLEKNKSALGLLEQACKNESDPDRRFALLLHTRNKPQIEHIAKDLRVPKRISQLCLQLSRHHRQLSNYPNLLAAQRHMLLSLCGGIKNPDALHELVQLVCLIHSHGQLELPLFNYEETLTSSINRDLALINSVNPRGLMEQGFRGASLGSALVEAQIGALEEGV